MTIQQLYLAAKRRFIAAGIDSPAFDAAALVRRFFGLDRSGLALHGGTEAPAEAEALFLQAVTEREARRPLQYILSSWEFMGLSLRVGEGVLIPREDTAVLVEAAAERLRGQPSPRGLDLCAGTGAVGLGLCSLLPDAEAICIELSPEAFPFLKRNLSAYPQYRTQAVMGDVLLPETAAAFPQGSFSFLLSNPPYIRAGELSGLQPEVQKEPPTALNGGEDGLLFYRAIASHWLPLLKPGGIVGVETGEDQGGAVCALFRAHGLDDIRIHRDWAGLNRAVTARRPK